MDKTQLKNMSNHPDHYRRDALMIALATHPHRELRELTEVISIENAERILEDLPDSLVALVRGCTELIV